MELLAIMAILFTLICIFASKVSDSQKEAYRTQQLLKSQGPVFPMLICPHCQTKGQVRTIHVKRKKGISGAKATGAVLTMGFSMLATGLSRKEDMTHATCGNCGSVWDF